MQLVTGNWRGRGRRRRITYPNKYMAVIIPAITKLITNSENIIDRQLWPSSRSKSWSFCFGSCIWSVSSGGRRQDPPPALSDVMFACIDVYFSSFPRKWQESFQTSSTSWDYSSPVAAFSAIAFFLLRPSSFFVRATLTITSSRQVI